MTQQELRHVFGNEDADAVDYEVVYIHQHGRPKKFDAGELLRERDSAPVKRKYDEHLAHYSFDHRGKQVPSRFLARKYDRPQDTSVSNGVSMMNRNYQLKLSPNTLLAAPQMKIVVRGEATEEIVVNQTQCHYVHADNELVVALSHCAESDVVSRALLLYCILFCLRWRCKNPNRRLQNHQTDEMTNLT